LASGPVPDLARPPSIRDFLDESAWHARRYGGVRLASLKSWSIHFHNESAGDADQGKEKGLHERSSWDGCSDSLSPNVGSLDVDAGVWASESETYGSTNNSERGGSQEHPRPP